MAECRVPGSHGILPPDVEKAQSGGLTDYAILPLTSQTVCVGRDPKKMKQICLFAEAAK